MLNREAVRALVSAFNVHNYFSNTLETNFVLQSRYGKDCIVVSFDKGMNGDQCSEYLYNIKRKIVGEFYGIEKGDTDEVVLNTAELIFDVKSFPFNSYKGGWSVDKQGRIEFVASIDQGVISNLKSHLASSLKRDVIEDMSDCRIVTKASNKKDYLWHGKFPNKNLCKEFEREFLSRMRGRYENVPKDPLEVKDNSVYIKDVFDDARFIDSVTRYKAWLVGMDLGVGNDVDHRVESFKNMIIRSTYSATEVIVDGFILAPPLNSGVVSILTPIIQNGKEIKLLTKEEAHAINRAFNNVVLDDVSDKVQAEISVNGSSGIYGIDFSNKEISHCMITKIIESSVINKDHELSIDPERALSPAQSLFNSPIHAGPSGLRTPTKRQEDRDSGYDSNSPPKPKDSGASSGSPGPSIKLSDMELESPKRSQDGVLKESPRQGLEEPFMLHRGTSKEFSPWTYISSATVVSKPSSLLQSVGAAQNVPAGFNLRAQSGPSSWKGANPVGANPWAQQTNPCLSQGTSENKWISSMQFTKPGPSGLSWSQSGPSSWKGANINMSKWTSTLRSYSPLPPLIPISGSVPGLQPPTQVSSSESSSSKGASERGTSDKPLTEEEEKLFKALLYVFNLNNYIFGCPHANCIVENGKIASLINDDINVKEYLKELRNSTIEEYYHTEGKAKEACDLNEFPFKFLSNCEKNQETTVVANVSRGALFNLKKLFIQGHEYREKVKIEDISINIIKKAVRFKKDEWLDSEVRKGLRPEIAITSCYPDESKLKYIPIVKGEGGYWLDRDCSPEEVKSFRGERWPAKGKSVAGKVNPEDNKDSAISSGEATDAENVSSKAEATTSSGYESVDCENTRERSPKRSGEKVVQTFKKQCIVSTQIEDVTSESFGQRQGSIVG